MTPCFMLFTSLIAAILARGVCLDVHLVSLANALGVVTLILAVAMGYAFWSEE